jgi:hypothetical protein
LSGDYAPWLDVRRTVFLETAAMTISILLRLRADRHLNQQLAGQAEVVDTGKTGTFAHVADLIAFLEASIASAAEGDSAPDSGRSDASMAIGGPASRR